VCGGRGGGLINTEEKEGIFIREPRKKFEALHGGGKLGGKNCSKRTGVPSKNREIKRGKPERHEEKGGTFFL